MLWKKILKYKWQIIVSLVALVVLIVYLGWNKFWYYWNYIHISDIFTVFSPILIWFLGQTIREKVNKEAIRDRELLNYHNKYGNILIELTNIKDLLYDNIENNNLTTCTEIINLKKQISPLSNMFQVLFKDELKNKLKEFDLILSKHMTAIQVGVNKSKNQKITSEIIENIEIIIPLIEKVGVEHE